MKPKQIVVKISGLSDMLHNRKSFMLDRYDHEELNKQKNEGYNEYEARIWKNKACVNEDGNVVIMGEWIKRSLVASQRRGKNPVKPVNARGRNETMMPYFISGILIEDSEIESSGEVITVPSLIPYKSIVSIPKGGSVFCIRPLIKMPWTSKISIMIMDEMVSEECLVKCIDWVGCYSGIGDFRPQHGGNFGRFEVVK